MATKTKVLSAWIVLSMFVLACNFSFGGGPSEAELLGTAVAQTVTAAAGTQANQVLLPTTTISPTITQVIAPTSTPQPCNKAEFVSETIPDDTSFNPNQSFTKTWRLRNVGTCTWNTNYKLVFFEGNQMNGPATKNLTQSVAPGEQVDFSVDLKAPASGGTYKGTWRVRDDNDQVFVFNIWVQIKVTAPLTEKTVTLNAVVNEGGSVYNNGDVFPELYGVGDNTSNNDVQAFMAFDISGIPSNANILEVKTDFSGYATLGNPFGGLGCLRAYMQTYRPLDVGDYTGGSPLGAVARWCNAGELTAISVQPDMKGSLQGRVGSNYFPLRMQFNQTKTDSDNANDAILFSNMKLIVKYES
ncbi:MAG: hypothetical protein FJZ98_00845 [Chloroflexi bacterium]|nr:hypothetical protein [Chloroflexota bacterium]